MNLVSKNLSHLTRTLPDEVRGMLCLLISALVCVLFTVYLVPYLPHFCAFCCWFCCVKWPPSAVVKCCLVFLSARRLWCGLQRKYMCEMSFVQAWILMLLAEFNVNESATYAKQGIFKHTHKTRLSIYQLTKMWSKAHGKLIPYLPKEWNTRLSPCQLKAT